MARWPDGSLVAEDPHAAARRLEAEMVGWRCWYGDKTGAFWAIQRGRSGRLVEAETADALHERMMNQTPAAPSPGAPGARGWGGAGRAAGAALRM